MVFWPIFDPKISFLRFYPGKLRDIASKPLLIDSMVKNTSRKVYLESLTYRAENARKSFYYNDVELIERAARSRGFLLRGLHCYFYVWRPRSP